MTHLRRLLQRINLIRKPQDLFAVRDEHQVEDAKHVRNAETGVGDCLCAAIEKRFASRVLSDLLVGQVDEVLAERHRQRLAGERADVKAGGDAA